MKFKSILLIFIICSSCKKVEQVDKTKTLPFYNSEDFTPEWISKTDENFDKIHRIAPFKFTNQNGEIISNKNFEGKIYIADFFFTTCPSICPIMTKNLVELQNHFEYDEDFGIASFSITPHYDTPKVLKTYAEKYGVKDMDWHLMTGDKDAIYDLANGGFNIFAAEMPDSRGGFEHSGLFALVDRQGYLRSRLDKFGNPIVYYRGAITEEMGENSQGEKEEISILKEDIKKLLEE